MLVGASGNIKSGSGGNARRWLAHLEALGARAAGWPITCYMPLYLLLAASYTPQPTHDSGSRLALVVPASSGLCITPGLDTA